MIGYVPCSLGCVPPNNEFFAGKADRRTLQHLWAQARALTERQTERLAPEWGSPEAQRAIRFDLIEAKHHLQMARSAR